MGEATMAGAGVWVAQIQFYYLVKESSLPRLVCPDAFQPNQKRWRS